MVKEGEEADKDDSQEPHEAAAVETSPVDRRESFVLDRILSVCPSVSLCYALPMLSRRQSMLG